MSEGTGTEEDHEGEPRHGDGWRAKATPRRTRLLLTALGAVLVLAAVLLPVLSLWPRVQLCKVGLAVGLLAWSEPDRRRQAAVPADPPPRLA